MIRDLIETNEFTKTIEVTRYQEKIGSPVLLAGVSYQQYIDYPPSPAFKFNDREFLFIRAQYTPDGISFVTQDKCSFILASTSLGYTIMPGLKTVAQKEAREKLVMLGEVWQLAAISNLSTFVKKKFQVIANSLKKVVDKSKINTIAGLYNAWVQLKQRIYIPDQISGLGIFKVFKGDVPPISLAANMTIFDKLSRIARIIDAYFIPTILADSPYYYMMIPSTWPYPSSFGISADNIETSNINLSVIPSRGLVVTTGSVARHFDPLKCRPADKFPNFLERKYNYLYNTMASIPLPSDIKEIDEYNQTLTLRFRNDVERVFRDRERVQPLPEFNLSAGEELVMAKVKMRPCIVISKYRKKNIKGYMVFPLTSFKGNTKEELIRAFKTCTFNRPFSWLIKTIDVRHYNPTNPVYDYSMILMHHLRFVNERYVRKGKTRISERAFRYMIIHFFYSMGLLNFSIEKGEDRNFITSLKELRDVQQLGKDILRKYCK